jgi:hypothetical protein
LQSHLISSLFSEGVTVQLNSFRNILDMDLTKVTSGRGWVREVGVQFYHRSGGSGPVSLFIDQFTILDQQPGVVTPSWVRATGPMYDNDGRLFSITKDSFGRINPSTGDLAWSRSFSPLGNSQIKASFVNPNSSSLVFVAENSLVYAYDKVNGNCEWTTVVNETQIFQALVDVRDNLYFITGSNSANAVSRVSKVGGRIMWEVQDLIPAEIQTSIQFPYTPTSNPFGKGPYLLLKAYGYPIQPHYQAIDPSTGSVAWEYFNFPPDSSVQVYENSDANLFLFSVSSFGTYQLVGVDRATGQNRWSYNHTSFFYLIASNAADGLILAQSGGALIALDPLNGGAQVWSYSEYQFFSTNIDAKGRAVISASEYPLMYTIALNSNGTIRYRRTLNLTNDNGSSPRVQERYDVETGELIWRFTGESLYSYTNEFGNDTVVLDGKNLVMLSTATGAVRWRAVVIENFNVIQADDRFLYLSVPDNTFQSPPEIWTIDRSTGVRAWRYPVPNAVGRLFYDSYTTVNVPGFVFFHYEVGGKYPQAQGILAFSTL